MFGVWCCNSKGSEKPVEIVGVTQLDFVGLPSDPNETGDAEAEPEPAALGDVPEAKKVPSSIEPTMEVKAEEIYMEVVFAKPDGSNVPVRFTRKPMGFDFSKGLPLTMRRVKAGSHAEEVGVEVGWYVMSVNGESMHGKKFQEIYDALQKGAADIPLLKY